tara:strand:+ start:342 stop:1184 length:843 start_codon:yes stop_codon:yes gene_type:complete
MVKILTYIFLIISITAVAQEQKTENFIYRHQQFKYNDRGILITPIDTDINRRVSNFVNINFNQIVESVRNVVWESYQTSTNPMSKSHIQKYIVRVQIKNNNENKEYRYLEVEEDLVNNDFFSNYIFDKSQRNFVLEKKEIERRSFLPDLEKLEIKNIPKKTSVDNIIREYKELVLGENKSQIPNYAINSPEHYRIYDIIVDYIKNNFSNVALVMNLSWDSYNTFLSNYDIYHYHTYIVQVRLKDSPGYRFIEVFYNPFNNTAVSDFAWNNQNRSFERKLD